MRAFVVLLLIAAVGAGWFGYKRLQHERACSGVSAGVPAEYGATLIPAARAGASRSSTCR